MRHYQIIAQSDFKQYRPPYINPYKKAGGGNRIIFWLLALLVMMFTWAGAIFLLPYFRITKVTYYGLEIIRRAEFDDMLNTKFFNHRLGFIPGDNYFLVNTDRISREARNIYSLESITVKKTFPDSLLIDLKEKTSAVIYDNGQKYFLLDKNGTAVKYLSEVLPVENMFVPAIPSLNGTSTQEKTATASSTGGQIVHQPDFRRLKNNFGQYPLIYDENHPDIMEKQTGIVPPIIIKIAINWQEMMEKEGVGEIRYFVLENPLNGLIAETDKGWRLFIQPDHDLQTQMVNLKTILKNSRPKEYIDLRFNERVYWK